jgi:hypothetical protein
MTQSGFCVGKRANVQSKSASSTVQEIQELSQRVTDLADLVEHYEDLIIERAEIELRSLFLPVLRRLSSTPSHWPIGSALWPYTTPLRDVGFLEHLFWAKHEREFDEHEWRTSFEKTALSACRAAIDENDWFRGLAFDLLSSACVIEQGSASLDDIHDWSTKRLFALIWPDVIDADISIRDDNGLSKDNE